MSTGKAKGKGDKSFEQQLALYRAKVYEKYMLVSGLDSNKSGAIAESESSPILVIEDNADDWLLMQWALRQAFPTTKMILLDLYLPSVSKGLHILRSFKTHHRLREIPVIIVSRSSDANDMANAFKYASSLYIIKPPTYSEWVKRMGELRKLVSC